MTRFTTKPVVGLVALAVGATIGSAQSQAILDADKASNLIVRAEQLQKRSELSEKARLFEEAASLLPASDPRRSSALLAAGTIASSLGRFEQAMHLLERSAESAARRGGVIEAADTYVAALFVALNAGDRAAARRFIDRAISLTGSPEMPDADRSRILRRISQPARQLGAQSPASPNPANSGAR